MNAPMIRKTAGLFILVGLMVVSAKMLLGWGITPPQSYWRVSVVVTIPPQQMDQRVALARPWNTSHFEVFRQALIHPDLSAIRASGDGPKRALPFRIKTPYSTWLQADFDWRIRPSGDALQPTTLTLASRTRLLEPLEGILLDRDQTRLNALLELPAGQPRLDALLAFFATRAPDTDLEENEEVEDPSLLKLVAMARQAELPARTVVGVALENSANAPLLNWVEILIDDQWVSLVPDRLPNLGVPAHWVPLAKNGLPVVSLAGDILPVNVQVRPQTASTLSSSPSSPSPWQLFDLQRLSVEQRETLGILLLLPLGVLLTAIIRAVFRVSSYGVFSSTLLALSMLYGEPLYTASLFTLVILLSVVIRSWTLPRTDLTRFARLTLIFTIVALVMSFVVSLLIWLGFSGGEGLALLPVVILTTLVDRVYGDIDEHGLKAALKRLGWTIAIALACSLVLRLETLAIWLTAYPEAHLLTIGLTLLMSSLAQSGLKAPIKTGPKSVKKTTDTPLRFYGSDGFGDDRC